MNNISQLWVIFALVGTVGIINIMTQYWVRFGLESGEESMKIRPNRGSVLLCGVHFFPFLPDIASSYLHHHHDKFSSPSSSIYPPSHLPPPHHYHHSTAGGGHLTTIPSPSSSSSLPPPAGLGKKYMNLKKTKLYFFYHVRTC